MDILVKLADLANTFDAKGLFDEAAVLDQIVRHAADAKVDPMWDKKLGQFLADEIIEGLGDTSDQVLVNMKKEFAQAKAKGSGLESLIPLLTKYGPRVKMKGDDVMQGIEAKYQGYLTKHYQQQQQKAEQEPSVATETDPKAPAAGKGENLKVKEFQMKYNELRKQLFTKKIMSKEEVKAQFPWIKADGKWGQQTKKAKDLMPAMQKKLQEGVSSETGQRAPAAPAAPQSQADPAVVKEQGVNKLFGDAVTQLQGMGYTIDADKRTLLMQRVRQQASSPILDIGTPEGQAKILPILLKEMQSDLGQPGAAAPQ